MTEVDQTDKQIVQDLKRVEQGLGVPKESGPVIVGGKGNEKDKPPAGKVVVDALKRAGLSEDELPPDALRVISDMNQAKDLLE